MALLVSIRGAVEFDLDLERSLQLVVLIFGNGLEGDIRVEADTERGVEALRTLVKSVASASSVEPPRDARLYQPGDECYRQHDSARVFLNPVPRLKTT